MTLIRVMTYNILRGGRHPEALEEVVRAAAPDILLVNESPKRPVLWKRDCLRLARDWNLRYVVGGRPAGSNLVLCGPRVAVRSADAIVLPQPRLQPRRGIASAQLKVEGRLLGVVSCHLSLAAERRLGEVGRVLEAAGRLREPVIVAGDLNEPPAGPSWDRLRTAGYLDRGSSAWRTFRADDPRRRIDALLVKGPADTRSHGDPGVPLDLLASASDHRPVLAELDL